MWGGPQAREPVLGPGPRDGEPPALRRDVLQAIGNFDVALASLESLPWRFSLRLPPRTLGSLPSDLRERVGVTPALAGLEVAATMGLRGGAFQTRGVLMASSCRPLGLLALAAW